MNTTLRNKRIAILAADGFEQVELEGPMEALKTASAEVKVVSLKPGKIVGMNHTEKGAPVKVDLTLEEAEDEEFEGLMIPGGLYNPDTLRSTPAAVEFTRKFAKAGKPIAAICHGPWVLIEAGVAEGRRMTS
jgi:protease I